MKVLRVILFCAAGMILSSCGGKHVPASVRTDGVYALKQAALQSSVVPRYSGSAGATKACRMIVQEAMNLGYFAGVQVFHDMTPEGEKIFGNIEAVLPGKKSSFVILAAHYDTKKMALSDKFQGANDGGSGVGILLAVMKAMKDVRPEHTVRFCFFDGEEALQDYSEKDGLHGSRHYAERLKKSGEYRNCKAMILLDMAGDKDLVFALPSDQRPEWLRKLVFRSAAELGHPEKVVSGGPVMLDDHVPFAKLGIPSVDLIDFEYGPGNAFWHTEEDTVDKLSAESLAFSGDLAISILTNVP